MKKNPDISCSIHIPERNSHCPAATYDIVVNVYKNRIFIVVTHLKKIGVLINVTREAAVPGIAEETYETGIIFGENHDSMHAIARHIAEQIDIDRPLLLSFSNPNCPTSHLKKIISAIKKFKTW